MDSFMPAARLWINNVYKQISGKFFPKKPYSSLWPTIASITLFSYTQLAVKIYLRISSALLWSKL
jgi:hypothetical protein